jgi:hypothetical protein
MGGNMDAKSVLLVVASLLTAAPAVGQAGLLGQSGESAARYIRFDPVSAGPSRLVIGRPSSYWSWTGTALKVTWQTDHWRYGVAAVEFIHGDPLRYAIGHVGYSFLLGPVKTWFFYSAMPDVYLELSASPLLPIAKSSLGCNVDFYGVGLTGEVGAYAGMWMPPMLFATVQVRLATFSIKR